MRGMVGRRIEFAFILPSGSLALTSWEINKSESRKKVGFSSQRKNIMPKTARVQTVGKKNGEKENDEGSVRGWFYPQDSGQLQ